MPKVTILKRPREESVITQRMFFKKTARGKVIKGITQSSHHESFPHVPDFAQFYAKGTFGMIYLAVLTDVGHATQQCRPSFRDPGTRPTNFSPLGTISCPILMCSCTGMTMSIKSCSALKISKMDLIESNYFMTPIIVLQTVMEEVRHRSLALYSRLKALTTMGEHKNGQ
jgi:exosome complex exonuclease DIS3/RRP44